MFHDALEREESCGGHFREEHQTDEGEARRNDKKFAHVASLGISGAMTRNQFVHKENLEFEHVKFTSEELQSEPNFAGFGDRPIRTTAADTKPTKFSDVSTHMSFLEMLDGLE